MPTLFPTLLTPVAPWLRWPLLPGTPPRRRGPPLTALGPQEEEDRDESGCEEEEGREDDDEDSGSEESLVGSDSDPEEKGACAWAGLAPRAPLLVSSGPAFWLGAPEPEDPGVGTGHVSAQISKTVDVQGPELSALKQNATH